MYLERHKNLTVSNFYALKHVWEYLIQDDKAISQRFLFLTAYVFLQVRIYYLYTSAIKPNSQATERNKKTKKKHQPAHHTSLRNTMCLQAETSVIMCNHFYARLKKLLGSVKYNSLMTPYPYKAVCTFLKYCITKSNST